MPTPDGAVRTVPRVRIALDGPAPVLAYAQNRFSAMVVGTPLEQVFLSRRGMSGWSHTTVRETAEWGRLGAPSLMLSSSGAIVAFTEVRLGGSRLDEIEWVRTFAWSEDEQGFVLPALEGPVAHLTESAGVFHAVTTQSDGPLGYASLSSFEWQQEAITDDYYFADRIEVAAEGPVIAFTAENAIHAARQSNEWAVEVVDAANVDHESMRYDLTIDESGVPHVCYSDAGGLYTASPGASGWDVVQQRDETRIWGCALGFGGGDMHFVYVQEDAEGNARVRYFR